MRQIDIRDGWWMAIGGFMAGAAFARLWTAPAGAGVVVQLALGVGVVLLSALMPRKSS